MPVQKELSDLENGASSAPGAGTVPNDKLSSPVGAVPQTPMAGKKGEDHVLDFNVANFSTPKGKQILHDVGTFVLLTHPPTYPLPVPPTHPPTSSAQPAAP